MAFFRSKWGRVVIGLGILLGIFAITRLYNLTLLPIFTDEAIYIRWSQIGARDANWRFISLTDGKQPLFTWVMMALLRLLPSFDPLFVGRLTSVLAGAGTLVGLWFLAWELFGSRKVAWLTSILYLLSPFALVYDRMALYDALVATFYIANLYLAIRLVREMRLDLALILGMTLGAGMLNKSSGFISLYLLPATLLLFDWRGPGRLGRLGKWVGLAIVAAVLSQALYSVLRLAPLFHMVAQKDAVFVYPLSEWWEHPFRFLEGNLRGMFDWLRGYLTLPIFILAMIPFFARWPKVWERLLLYIFWAAPFVALALFGRVLYPRFIFFMTMPLLVVAALSLETLWQSRRWRLVVVGIVGWAFLLTLPTNYWLLTSPVRAMIPTSDRGQYINDWPAGWGIREVVAFLRAEAGNHKVVVVTEGTFGLLPAAIEIYLVDNPNVEIRSLWPVPDTLPADIASLASHYPTYFVLNQDQEPPSGWPLELVAEYAKGTSGRKMRFYRLIPPLALLPL